MTQSYRVPERAPQTIPYELLSDIFCPPLNLNVTQESQAFRDTAHIKDAKSKVTANFPNFPQLYLSPKEQGEKQPRITVSYSSK